MQATESNSFSDGSLCFRTLASQGFTDTNNLK
jgi:hypothetical protein